MNDLLADVNSKPLKINHDNKWLLDYSYHSNVRPVESDFLMCNHTPLLATRAHKFTLHFFSTGFHYQYRTDYIYTSQSSPSVVNIYLNGVFQRV